MTDKYLKLLVLYGNHADECRAYLVQSYTKNPYCKAKKVIITRKNVNEV